MTWSFINWYGTVCACVGAKYTKKSNNKYINKFLLILKTKQDTTLSHTHGHHRVKKKKWNAKRKWNQNSCIYHMHNNITQNCMPITFSLAVQFDFRLCIARYPWFVKENVFININSSSVRVWACVSMWFRMNKSDRAHRRSYSSHTN